MAKWLITLVVLATAWTPVFTATAASNLPDGTERVLAGHGFIPSNFLGDPFVGTYFANHVGGGVAYDISTAFRNLDGDVLFTLEGDVVYGALGLEFQQNLWSDFAVGVEGEGMARAGTNAQSFIAEGADVNRSCAFWGKWRTLRSENVQLALGLNWSYNQATFFTPRTFAEHIAGGGDLEDAPLVVNDKSWDTNLSYDVAWAMSQWFGLRFSGLSGLYEVPGQDSEAKALHRLGVLGSLDLNQVQDVPLGFTLGYFWGTPDDTPQTSLKGLLLGIWYTGETNLQLGIEIGALQTRMLGMEEDVDGAFALLTTRYYF